MADNDILRTTQSRVFMTLSASSPGIQPEFQECMVLGGITQSFGDREAIYCQDPYRIGRFKTIGFTESPIEPVETSLNGRFPLDGRSILVRAARSQAKIDVHVHMGAIGANPQVFSGWRKKFIFKGARLSSLDIDEIGSHDEDTPVSHSVDLTADDWYEIVPLTFTSRGSNVATVPVVGATLFYNGLVELPPRERILALAVTSVLAGSPVANPSLLYSLDQGSTWYAADIDTITTSSTTSPLAGVAVIGDYVAVASSNSANYGLHFVRWDSLTSVVTPEFTQVQTGFEATKLPQAIFSLGSVGFVAAKGGYVYKVTNVPSGATVLSAGSASVNDLTCIAALNENVIIAGGASNTVLVCTDGENFNAVTGPAVGASITAVAALGAKVFLAGTSTGRLFYTTNGGASWTEKGFSGSGAAGGAVKSLVFPTEMVGYMSFATASAASLLMTTDGGYSWDAVPSGGVLSYTSGYHALAALRDDPNIVLAVGPGAVGTGGSILMGEPVE